MLTSKVSVTLNPPRLRWLDVLKHYDTSERSLSSCAINLNVYVQKVLNYSGASMGIVGALMANYADKALAYMVIIFSDIWGKKIVLDKYVDF